MDHQIRLAPQVVHWVVLKGHENDPIGRCARGGGWRTLGFVAAAGVVFLA